MNPLTETQEPATILSVLPNEVIMLILDKSRGNLDRRISIIDKMLEIDDPQLSQKIYTKQFYRNAFGKLQYNKVALNCAKVGASRVLHVIKTHWAKTPRSTQFGDKVLATALRKNQYRVVDYLLNHNGNNIDPLFHYKCVINRRWFESARLCHKFGGCITISDIKHLDDTHHWPLFRYLDNNPPSGTVDLKLHIACYFNNIPLIRWYVKCGFEIDIRCLECALIGKRMGLVRYFIETLHIQPDFSTFLRVFTPPEKKCSYGYFSHEYKYILQRSLNVLSTEQLDFLYSHHICYRNEFGMWLAFYEVVSPHFQVDALDLAIRWGNTYVARDIHMRTGLTCSPTVVPPEWMMNQWRKNYLNEADETLLIQVGCAIHFPDLRQKILWWLQIGRRLCLRSLVTDFRYCQLLWETLFCNQHAPHMMFRLLSLIHP